MPKTATARDADAGMKPGSWLLPAVCAGLLLCGFSAWNLHSALRMQAGLDRNDTIEQARGALLAPLRAGQDAQLRTLAAKLVADSAMGLRYLAVRDARGGVLASAGRFENLRLPALSGAALQTVRGWLYAFGSESGQMALSENGKDLGSVDYVVASGLDGRVHDAAVQRLLWTGGAGLLAGALLLLWIASRRSSPAAVPDRLRERLQPGMRGAGGEQAPEVEMQVAQALRLRVGGSLDQLQYGLILADKQGRVTYLNRVAETLTGWPLADARERMVYSVFHPIGPQGEPLTSATEQALKDGREVTGLECRLRARTGGAVQIEMMASLLRAADGSIDGAAMLFRDMGASHRKLEEVKRQSRLSQGVIDHLEEGLLTTDQAGVVRFANARAMRMFGYSREELEGVTVTKLMPVPFLNTPSIKLMDYAGARSNLKLPKVVGWRKDATTFPVELQVQPMSMGDDSGLIVIIRDISERLRGDNLATRLGRLLDSALEEVYIFDAQSLYFLDVNRGARKNLGYRQEQLARLTPLTISANLEESDFLGYLSRLRGGEVEHLSYRCSHRRSDGSEYPVEVRLNFSREEEPPVFMAIAVDISERVGAEEKLKHMAHHDALTGLPTRAVLYDRLRQALFAAQRSNRMVAVYFVDVDLFKQINDTHGHDAGDAVLTCVSERLKSLVRASDTVARLAGDEFIVVATGIHDAQDAQDLGNKIAESFRSPLDIPGQELSVTVSVGCSVYPLDDSDVDALLRHADSAMYTAKRGGRDGCRMFSADIDPDRRRRLDLEREIHAAVALNQYRMLRAPVSDERGQPRANLVSVGWEHPRYGRIGTAETLRAATRAGLLADLELWMICNSCAQLHQAAQERAPLLPVMVGVSGWQLRDADFGEHVLHLLKRFEVPPRMLILGLTPDGLAEAASAAPEHLETLRKRGLRFALRDFGGGFDLLERDSAVEYEWVLLPESLASRVLDDDAAAKELRRIVEAVTASGRVPLVPAVGDSGTRAYLRTLGAVLIADSPVEAAA